MKERAGAALSDNGGRNPVFSGSVCLVGVNKSEGKKFVLEKKRFGDKLLTD